MEQQLQPSPTIESTQSQTPSEPSQEISDDVDESAGVSVLPPPEQTEAEVSQEGWKKKKRSFL